MTPSRSDPSSAKPDFAAIKAKAEAFFSGEMPAEERDAFERQLVDDPELALAVYTAMGMGPVFHEARAAMRVRRLETHARIADRSVSKQVPWWGRTRSRFVLAVVTAAVVFLVIFVSNIGEPPPDTTPTDLVGTGLSPAGPVEPLPTQFSWPARPTAHQYRFEIRDDSDHEVYATLTAGTTLIVAIDALAEKGFRRGHWRVVPLDEFGVAMTASESVPIRVQRR